MGCVVIGETVTVYRRVAGSKDAHGNPTYTWQSESVSDVLVAPGPRADLSDSERPDGYRVVWNLHFPKGYPETLANAEVSVRGGERLTVIGDPQHYTEANTPTRWSMPVELWRVDG